MNRNNENGATEEEKVKRSSFTVRLVWLLLGVFFVIMIVSQLYIHFYSPLKTEVATLYETIPSVAFKGVYVRNERLVAYDGGGVVSFTHTDGSKLAKNSVVAKVYASQKDIELQALIDEKQEQIEVLSDAESLIGSDNSQLEAFSNQISENHSRILQLISERDFSGAADMMNGYLNLQSKKKIVKGEEDGYTAKITQLETEIASLKAQISSQPTALQIGEAGYFVSAADGYENTLSRDTIKDLTAEQIENIEKNPTAAVADNVIGKIVDSYKWSLVAVFDTDEVNSVFDGATVKLRAGSGMKTITVKVSSINKQPDGKTILIFESDILSADFVEGRVSQFKLLLDNYSGIRIPAKAVNFDEQNRQGVYIKSGVEMIFKLIKTVWSTEDYIIVEDTTEEPGYISLYDNVIVEGTDLRDGKIIS